MGVKQCMDCEQTKPASDFYSNRANKDGLNSYCRGCDSARSSRYQKSEAGKKMMARHTRKMYQKNRDKQLARAKLNVAIKARKVIKPELCGGCGASVLKLEGHHKDYSKPLEVNWLCVLCHKHAHDRLTDLTLLSKIGAIGAKP